MSAPLFQLHTLETHLHPLQILFGYQAFLYSFLFLIVVVVDNVDDDADDSGDDVDDVVDVDGDYRAFY